MNWMQYILEFSHHLKHVREIGHGQKEEKKAKEQSAGKKCVSRGAYPIDENSYTDMGK